MLRMRPSLSTAKSVPLIGLGPVPDLAYKQDVDFVGFDQSQSLALAVLTM